MFFLLIALASADPLITKVGVGDRAPFEGRLFNDEAVAIVLADSELAVQQCEIKKRSRVEDTIINTSIRI